MESLDTRRIAANAYRVLGLPADATQAQIDQAARKMRIWPDPSRIPPSPWDLPWLGPIGRSRAEIEQAVVQLSEPATRIRDRLLWFSAASEVLAGAQADTLLETAHAVRGAAHGAAAHDAALVTLLAVMNDDTQGADAQRWRGVVQKLRHVAESDDFLSWLLEVENAGQFEKPVSAEETAAALRLLPGATVGILVARAEEQLGHEMLYGCSQIIAVLNLCALSMPEAQQAAVHLQDRMEDAFKALCSQMEDDLRAKIVSDPDNYNAHVSANSAACHGAAHYYQQHVAPVLEQLELTGDGDRLLRVRTSAASVLGLLGVGWIWSNDVTRAERTFEQALQLARGTPLEQPLKADVERARNLRIQRQRTVQTVIRRGGGERRVVRASGGGPSWLWIWIIVGVVGAIIRGVASSSSRSTPSGTWNSPSPNWASPAPGASPAPSRRNLAPVFPQPSAPGSPAFPSMQGAAGSGTNRPRPLFGGPEGTAKDGNQQALLRELTQDSQPAPRNYDEAMTLSPEISRSPAPPAYPASNRPPARPGR